MNFLRISPGKHRNQHDNGRQDNTGSTNRSHSVVCDYCEHGVHVMAECWSLQQKKKPDVLVRTVNEPVRLSEAVVDSKPSEVVSESKSQGDALINCVPVKILCDTGATYSLSLQSVLPLTEQSSASVLVQGIELSVVKVPLHKVYLTANVVSGVVTVGIKSSLLIQGIPFILGKELVGCKVDELQVVDKPKLQVSLKTELTDISSMCCDKICCVQV